MRSIYLLNSGRFVGWRKNEIMSMIEKAFIDRCLWSQPFGKDRTAFDQNEIPINIFNMTLEIL